MAREVKNWAGNYTYQARERVQPATLDELVLIVRRSDAVRALGSRHSFNSLADTEGTHVSMTVIDFIDPVDPASMTVRIGGGVRYGELAAALQHQGFALANLASLPHISVAGAVASATHGSGVGNGNLATAVVGLEIVRADGALVQLQEGDPDFAGAVVSLGALGMVYALTLRVEPTFDIAQEIFEGVPFEVACEQFDVVMGQAYSVSLFHRWTGPDFDQLWIKRRLPSDPFPNVVFGATKATQPLHCVPGMDPVNCSPQLGVPGPWSERLAHFKYEFTPSRGDELQTEYFVPRAQAGEALKAVRSLANRIAPLLFVNEVRTIARDNLWMSPACGEDVVGLHFTWRPMWPDVRVLLPDLESALAPFDPRPHWAKLFTMAPETVKARYARQPDFARLVQKFDPSGKFRNAFVAPYVS